MRSQSPRCAVDAIRRWLCVASQHWPQPGLAVRAQTRMVWLLSAPRGRSDDRGLTGGVGEAGEVGGLGVAHCTDSMRPLREASVARAQEISIRFSCSCSWLSESWGTSTESPSPMGTTFCILLLLLLQLLRAQGSDRFQVNVPFRDEDFVWSG